MVVRLLFRLAFAAVLLADCAVASAEVPRLSLRAPHDGAVLHAPEVLFVFTVPPQVEVLVQVDGRVRDLATVEVPGNREDLYHVTVPLEEGRHRIRLLHQKDEAEMASVAVTYIPPYSLRRASGESDRPYLFHTREREQTCADCHNLPEVFETVPNQPLSPAGKVCGACHPSVESSDHLHGPVAVYACFMCHEPEYEPARFAVKGSQASSCGSCHEGFLARVLGGKKFVHGPVAAGGCLACHAPHGGATQALVRQPPPDLCLLCHAETVSLPIERTLHGAVACTQCHDPHGGQAEMLLAREGNAFCVSCHANVGNTRKGHPMAGHPVSAEVDPSRPGSPMGCGSCHGAHATDDISKQNVWENEDVQIRFCRRCHY